MSHSLNAILAPISVPIAEKLDLPRLPAHFGTVVVSFLTFEAIQWVIAPVVFGWLFPEAYGKASKRIRQGWCVFSLCADEGWC